MLGWLRVPGCWLQVSDVTGCWLRSCGVIGVWLLVLLSVCRYSMLVMGCFFVVGDWVVIVFDLRKRGVIVK